MPVPWLDQECGYYALPGSFALARSTVFSSGRVYGQDASSGAAVACLLSSQYDCAKTEPSREKNNLRVLDVCCAPGLKLCAIADYLSAGLVVGVDISETRSAIVKNVLDKYHIDPITSGHEQSTSNVRSNVRIKVYCNDATTFGVGNQRKNLIFDSEVARDQAALRGKRKRMNKSARGRERKRLKLLEQSLVGCQLQCDDSTDVGLFDRVLVDAECSTDGSLKHVQKKFASGAHLNNNSSNRTPQALIPQLTDKSKLEELVQLQRRLASSGFRMLKPGGFMVYSTCSLSSRQNEEVVSFLLDKFHDAALVPVQLDSKNKSICAGSIPGTLRFLPCAGNEHATSANVVGGGFFLAKFTKS
jgi:16S rRNA C967 or C1407 C5-methylase (RsmB/RsmF family)